jgi:hypothetical protein
MDQQFREQIHDGDPQAIDGVEKHAKEDEDLKQPMFVNRVEKRPDLTVQERCQDVHRNKNCHAHAANAVQDKSQHWALAFIPQASCQADVSIQAHLRLLENLLFGSILTFSLRY